MCFSHLHGPGVLLASPPDPEHPGPVGVVGVVVVDVLEARGLPAVEHRHLAAPQLDEVAGLAALDNADLTKEEIWLHKAKKIDRGRNDSN